MLDIYWLLTLSICMTRRRGKDVLTLVGFRMERKSPGWKARGCRNYTSRRALRRGRPRAPAASGRWQEYVLGVAVIFPGLSQPGRPPPFLPQPAQPGASFKQERFTPISST